MTRHALYDDPRMREVAVPVATVWTGPAVARHIDEAAVRDLPDIADWTAALDEVGTPEHRLGLHGRTLTQLLLGEPALVLEEQGGWARVAALSQSSSRHELGYPGWVRRVHLAAPVKRTTGQTAFVVTPSASLTLDDGSSMEVSGGTALWVDSVADETVTTPLPGNRRGKLQGNDVRLSFKPQQPPYGADELLATGRRFLGVRYLWGGTSGWGLDCSGLVHLTLRSHGVLLPRDACDQAAGHYDIDPVAVDEALPGDLYFFARPAEKVYHVGFATRSFASAGVHTMLHAPEGDGVGLIEEAPIAEARLPLLVGAARIRQPLAVLST